MKIYPKYLTQHELYFLSKLVWFDCLVLSGNFAGKTSPLVCRTFKTADT